MGRTSTSICYLSTAPADAPAGAFGAGDTFVDLGSLKGNTGPREGRMTPWSLRWQDAPVTSTELPPVSTDLVDDIAELVRAAGEVTLRWFRREDLTVDRKGDGSPITAADRAAERFLREEIEKRFPEDSIVGEEEGDRRGTSGRTWVIDPIDGTKAFTQGVPLYTNLLALEDQHGPLVGVINVPALGETVAAGRGAGCTLNGEPCHVSDRADLSGAYLTTSGFGVWPAAGLMSVYESEMHLRTWGDGYGYVLVATGRAEAMFDPIANHWDLAPMPVIISEAGGRFSDLRGDVTALGGSGLATNGVLHDDILALLRT